MLDISMSPHTLNNSEWAVFTIVKRFHNNERTPYDYLHLVFQEKLRGYHEQQTVIPNDSSKGTILLTKSTASKYSPRTL